jgi:MATE family multidrug resistance protein
LVFLGQDPEVSEIASLYILYLFPAMFLFGLFDANRLFLNCLGEETVATILVCLTLPLHGTLSYFLVYRYGWGWPGVNISIFISYSFLLIAVTLYSSFMKNEDVRKAWHWPSRESFKDWWEIVKLGAGGAFLYMVEWTACEGLILFSGLLGKAEQSTLGLLLILLPIFLMFTFGMQYTVTIYVGKSLGDGKSDTG